jgi:hypothetical protein
MAASPTGRISDTAENFSGSWLPETETERVAVREQLGRLLHSPIFVNSKRCASLLRFVVDCALEGKTDHLKERTLGIDVFQRDPHYDTNHDPVVRTTAVEIRKRLAQYYMAPEHEHEIRICFPAGTYVPEFKLPAGWVPAKAVGSARNGEVTQTPRPVAETTPATNPRRVLWISLAGAAIVFLGGLFLLTGSAAPSALDRFWAPLFASREPVLLLIGRVTPNAPQAPPPVTVVDLQQSERVAFADAETLSRITGMMMKRGKPFHIRREQSATLEDLREGPVVLIGAFNNEWTLRLIEHGRYGFQRDLTTQDSWIFDRENPSDRKWLVHQGQPYRSVTRDYALVSRMLDPTTGELVVTAAGLTKYGTAAAGEFLSEPHYMQEVLRSAPRNWGTKNIQIVLSTTLVSESSGPPQVIATYFW